MFRNTIFFMALSVLLFACGLLDRPYPTDTPRSTPPFRSLSSSTSSLASADTTAELQTDDFDQDVQIHSLGGNGWAVAIADRMLIFDYVESGETYPPPSVDERILQGGYIDPHELSGYEVYVFVTHSHPDHFDDVIFEWQEHIPDIRYIFGWQAGNHPDHYYLSDPHAQIQVDGAEIYTINSYSDVPEVAFVVKVGGLVIYHNGDYSGSYVDDFEYLHTITDHIDIAFVIGWPYVSHQHFQQALLLAEMFNPPFIFSNCRQGNEGTCRQFAEMLPEFGVSGTILYAEYRGECFRISGGATE